MAPKNLFAPLSIVLSFTTLALFLLSLSIGPSQISALDAGAALFGPLSDPTTLVMREIRLPRALLGAIIGATLGLSGAVLQGFLRNPLAEPGLLGVSASASLGAVIAIYTGISATFALALPVFALISAFCAIVILLSISGRDSRTLTVILTGIAITSLAGALTALALNLSPNPFAAMEIMFWMMGSLTDRSIQHFWVILPFTLVGWVMLFSTAKALDALTLGPATAASMGYDLKRIQLLAILGTALAVGSATAVSGAIGFIGLIVPHLLRHLVGNRPSQLLPVSALGGASLLMAADILVRVIAPERDIKLGVVTALIGAPFFICLVWTHRGAKL